MSTAAPREVHLTIPVAPEMEIAATAQVAALGEWMELGRDKIDEVKMAVVEACINAFEHSGTPDHKVELKFRVATEAGTGSLLPGTFGSPSARCRLRRWEGVTARANSIASPTVPTRCPPRRPISPCSTSTVAFALSSARWVGWVAVRK